VSSDVRRRIVSDTAHGSYRLGALLMIGSAAFWAAGTVVSKAVLNDTRTAPLPLLTIQLATSVLALAVVLVLSGRSTRGVWRVGWTGLLEPGAAYGFGIVGLSMTSATNATVLGSLEPVIVPLLAWVVLRHRQDVVHLALVAVATTGAIVVAATGTDGGSNVVGDAFIVAGVVAAALYVVLSSRHVTNHHPAALAVVQQGWALALAVAVTAVAALVSTVSWPASTFEYVAAGASGVCLYAIPFSLYLYALQHLHVTTAAPYLCLIPVFGIAGSRLTLGEPISVEQLLGSIIVITSLLASARLGSAPPPPPPPSSQLADSDRQFESEPGDATV
jgi:drug/metabolite transporter (DMT)-like permease